MPIGVYVRNFELFKQKSELRLESRFWSKVDKTPGLGPNGDCWEWKATKIWNGYGRFGLNKKGWLAHRVSWLISHGDPGDNHVLHKCDNRACVNPNHLFLGTNYDNVQDRERKGRNIVRKGEDCGTAKLTEVEVIQIFKSHETLAVLAERYNVAKTTICAIKTQQNWKQVTERIKNG